MGNAMRDYYNAADTEVGYMIEGHYGWNEWCTEHGREHLKRGTSLGLGHRGIDIYEVTVSHREYKCYRCARSLWTRHQEDAPPADPFPAPKSGVIGTTGKNEYSL